MAQTYYSKADDPLLYIQCKIGQGGKLEATKASHWLRPPKTPSLLVEYTYYH